MDRTVPFDENEICDVCGQKGAFDFMGDLICGNCITTDKKGYVTMETLQDRSDFHLDKLPRGPESPSKGF